MNSVLLGAVVVDTLLAAGVRHVVLAPGSRSAPLALRLFDADRDGALKLHVRVDERVAAFTALGLAKATRAVVAVVTTSGTAAANLAPAAMEARAAGVALLFLTADRPAEAVGTGANQTGRQVGILGPSALDVIRLNSSSGQPHQWAAAVVRAHAVALGTRTRQPGPVQLNLELAAPLVGHATAPVPTVPRITASAARAEVTELPPGPRTVVVAGDAPPHVGAEARACAEVAGVPLLAEPSSNARSGPCAIAGYREHLAGPLGERVERVVVFGHPTLSRPMTALLTRPDVELVVVSDGATWHDIGSRAAVVTDRVLLPEVDPAWLQEWRSADTRIVAGHWGGRRVAQVVTESLGADDVLFLGPSAVIRDADFAPITHAVPTVYSNRGLAGIDGVVSTAIGVALGTDRRVTALLGDLTFQHDLGSLVLPASEPQPDVRIVVADDDGGAIFHWLEQGAPQHADAFERVFGTPQGLDLVAAASGLGWQAERVTSADALRAALARPGRRVIVAGITRPR